MQFSRDPSITDVHVSAYVQRSRTNFGLKTSFDIGAIRESSTGMPRPRRVNQPHLVYHVMARGNGRMRIFEDDDDYRHFVTQLGHIAEDFNIQCWNYCVMPNHYHVTLQPTLPNLSRAIHCLNTRYAQYWNRHYDKVGHVFQGRFKSQVVQCEGYLSCLCRYVARNPVRANLASAPEDWEWSSYAATIGLRPPPSFVNVSATLNLFGPGDEAVVQARFREFVAGEIDRAIDDRLRSSDPVVGDRLFRADILPRPDARSIAAHAVEINRHERAGGEQDPRAERLA